MLKKALILGFLGVCYSEHTVNGYDASQPPPSPCQALRPGDPDLVIDLITSYRLDEYQYQFKNVSSVVGSNQYEVAYHLNKEADNSIESIRAFPNGVPYDFSFEFTFRTEDRPTEPWLLFMLADYSHLSQMSVTLDPIHNTVKFSVSTTSGLFEKVTFQETKLFDSSWHKVMLAVKDDTVRLWVDCKPAQNDIGQESIPLLESRARMDTIAGFFTIAQDIDFISTIPIDLQRMVFSCDADKPARTTCEELDPTPRPIGPSPPKPDDVRQKCPEQCPAGLPGIHGLPGLPGLPGKPGPRGFAGKKGERGLPGLPGPRDGTGRLIGEGLPGVPGFPGPKGEKGAMGLSGQSGQKGEMGFVGLRGEAGVPGYPGADGLPGKDGAPGLQGLEGFPGERGFQGIPGLEGPPGPPGIQGQPGICDCDIGNLVQPLRVQQGERGFKGERGLDGYPGHPGPPGLPGVRGPAGPRSPPGPFGTIAKESHQYQETDIRDICMTIVRDYIAEISPTLVGPTGPRGQDGEKGARGEDGTGHAGPQGPQGPEGRGVDGIPGRPGERGEPGQPGVCPDCSYAGIPTILPAAA